MTEKTEADFAALFQAAELLDGVGALALYTAYREAVGGIAYNGEKIPDWQNLKWRAKWGWLNAYLISKTIARIEAGITANN